MIATPDDRPAATAARARGRRLWTGLSAAAVLAFGAWAGYRLWPRTIEIQPAPLIPVAERAGGRDAVRRPGMSLVAEIGRHPDEFYAYLMFQYFRGAPALQPGEVLLTYRRSPEGLVYPVEVVLEDDLIGSLELLARARASGLLRGYEWRYLNAEATNRLRYQTHVFETAYNLRAGRKLEEMSRAELLSYVRRFVLFKSQVDPRIRRKIEPVPRPLDEGGAHQLAADILSVADFYELPLEFFLGIGAMENNFMNVKGDLDHAVWKRRADPGDLVLKRRGGRVLVLNPASGVWQITRETLRYVHRLYLADGRDYSALPGHLRPPKELDLNEPGPEVLTTYAGLLFRDLLDRFDGNVALAVGAYNGGPGNPNARYEQGVRRTAEYARRVMQQAAGLHGRPAAGMQFMTAAR